MNWLISALTISFPRSGTGIAQEETEVQSWEVIRRLSAQAKSSGKPPFGTPLWRPLGTRDLRGGAARPGDA